MVLSGAERQKRHREKVKAMAREGVTPDMIAGAARISYERDAADPLNRLPPWAEYLADCNKRGNRKRWTDQLPTWDGTEPEDVALAREQFGEDADLILKVSAVVRAVTIPPTPDKA